MGQYYAPVIERDSKVDIFCPYDFGNGARLMEHSYVGNNFVNVVANEIVDFPARLYWVGDYSNEFDFTSPEAFQRIYPWNKSVDTTIENPNIFFDWSRDWFLVNQSKGVYTKVPHEGDFVISPIPLLTAVGNGRGGGDYRGDNIPMVGSWAGDIVYLTRTEPEQYADVTKYCDFVE